MGWVDLPQALLQIHILPQGKLLISPFEAMYRRSFVVTSVSLDGIALPKGGGEDLCKYLLGISGLLQETHRLLLEKKLQTLDPLHPGDWVYNTTWAVYNMEF